MPKVIDASYEMTGGGCHTYWGKFDDGNYFVFGLNVFQKLNADYGVTFTEEFFKETGGDTYKWEKKHKIGRMIEYPHVSKEIDEYIRQTFNILIGRTIDCYSTNMLKSLEASELQINKEEYTLYCAVMNIADYLALNENLDKETESKLYSMLDDLNEIGNIDIPSSAEANDCGYCETFPELVIALRKLFKNGNRIAIS